MKPWNAAQRACADKKCSMLSEATTEVVWSVNRWSQSAADIFRKAWNSIPKWSDVDHTVDLQLGWSKLLNNLSPLDSSVNRSLGAQIYQKIKNLPVGTKIWNITIRD